MELCGWMVGREMERLQTRVNTYVLYISRDLGCARTISIPQKWREILAKYTKIFEPRHILGHLLTRRPRIEIEQNRVGCADRCGLHGLLTTSAHTYASVPNTRLSSSHTSVKIQPGNEAIDFSVLAGRGCNLQRTTTAAHYAAVTHPMAY